MVYDFVGVKYYREILFNSSDLYDKLIPYFQEVVIMIPVIVIFALMISIMLNQNCPVDFYSVPSSSYRLFSTGAVLMSFINQGKAIWDSLNDLILAVTWICSLGIAPGRNP